MKNSVVSKKVNSFLFVLLIFLFVSVFWCMAILFLKSSDYIYADFLKKQMLLSYAPIAVFGFVFVLIGAIFFKKMGDEIIEKWMIIIWFVFSIIIVTYSMSILSIHYVDIKNGDCIAYTGEFEKDHTRAFIFLNDEKSTRLINTNTTFLDTGNFSGRIVYSKRSKYVLSYSLDTGENASVVD